LVVKHTKSNSAKEQTARINGVFATTRWSVVLAAQGGADSSQEALETLCRTYWFPVYAVVRRRGFDPETSRDLAQEFFARLLSRDGLANLRPERGRFRSFLAQSVKNFLTDEWDKARAQKRGGGQPILSLDASVAEGRYLETAHAMTPDLEFDRQWAEQLLLEARGRLHSEFMAAGKKDLLETLDRAADSDGEGLAQAAQRLQMPLNTLKSHLRRARLRHAAIIRELIAETVSTPAQVESELRELLEAIRS
jgi:RNA polymerase sigma-70 factor (ECF subfamily)